jgi:hypothetical protein
MPPTLLPGLKRIRFDGQGAPVSDPHTRIDKRADHPPMPPKIAIELCHVAFEDLGTFHTVLTLYGSNMDYLCVEFGSLGTMTQSRPTSSLYLAPAGSESSFDPSTAFVRVISAAD